MQRRISKLRELVGQDPKESHLELLLQKARLNVQAAAELFFDGETGDAPQSDTKDVKTPSKPKKRKPPLNHFQKPKYLRQTRLRPLLASLQRPPKQRKVNQLQLLSLQLPNLRNEQKLKMGLT